MMKQKCQKKEEKKDNKYLMNLGQYNNIIMEYEKVINFLDNALNQPSKLKKKKKELK